MNFPRPPIVRTGAWRIGHDRSIPGIRIDTGASHIFIANEHILAVANALADHLERNKNR